MQNVFRTYSSMSSAKRGVKRAGLNNVTYQPQQDNRIAVIVVDQQPDVKVIDDHSDTVVIEQHEQKSERPVAKFRKLFSSMYGTYSWSAVIKEAVANGINENTAKTYYYKLAREQQDQQNGS